MINHLKKVFDNYRLKVRDFEDKKFYIGFGDLLNAAPYIYSKDCIIYTVR